MYQSLRFLLFFSGYSSKERGPGGEFSSLWCSLVALQLLCPVGVFGQLQPLKFITYTTNEGLLHNHTKKCVEDKKGFIWIVSEIGVSRFDGVNFKNFQHDISDPSSLPHNTVHDIGVDEAGRIWLALEIGLCYYDPKEACFNPVDITGKYDKSLAVLSLCVDTALQYVWFMTDKALYRLNTVDFTIHTTTCKNPTPAKINAMYRASDESIWIACYRHGFIIYDISQDSATVHIPEAWAMNFYEANDTMWICNWHTFQLIAWDMAKKEYVYWKEKTAEGIENNIVFTGITSSPVTGDSMLLLSTQELGVLVFDMHQKKFAGGFNRDIFSKYSLPTDFINFIFTDSHQILWLCTWEGLAKVNILEQQFRSVEIPILRTPRFQYYNLIEGIVHADEPGTWWLGVNGCGIIKYDTASKSLVTQVLADISQPNQFKSESWTDFLLKTEDGTVWSAHTIGITNIRDGKLNQYFPPSQTFRPGRKTVCIGPDQSFWITTMTHLINFDPFSREYFAYEIDTSQHGPFPIRSSAESGFCSDGNLWTGTHYGLYSFNTSTHESQKIVLTTDAAEDLSINAINSLVTDGHETIYLGTHNGLGVYNIRTKEYQLKGREEFVYPILWKSMLLDKAGNLWIYTTHALFKYDPLRDEFSRFTTADGIYNFSSDPTHLFSFNDNFYIGYRGAYTEFDPLKAGVNQAMVKPLITDVFIDGQSQHFDPELYATQNLDLHARNNDIAFHFTGIDYTNSDRITFSYNLFPEKAWHDIGTNRSLTYTNLPPGGYAFQLKARNSSGILSDQVAVFNFSIAPSLTQHWWFWPSIALIFVMAVILIANRRVRKIREEERIRTETNHMMSQLETKLLRSQMNPHFIFNSLNSIQKYIWENKEEDAAEYLAQFAKLIRAILENSRKEFITLRQELDVLKLYIELEHRRSNGKFDFYIKVDENLRLDDILLPPLLLQPYIENAIWHGVNKKPGHGRIDIGIGQRNGLIEFTIDDDGVGRSFTRQEDNGKALEKISLGTDITQQRISHLQTETATAGVRIIDKQADGVPSGTTVIVSIPVKYQPHA